MNIKMTSNVWASRISLHINWTMVVCWEQRCEKKVNQAFSLHVIHLQWICYSHWMCRNVYLFVWMVLLMKSTRCRYSLKILEEKRKKIIVNLFRDTRFRVWMNFNRWSTCAGMLNSLNQRNLCSIFTWLAFRALYTSTHIQRISTEFNFIFII